jgi:zinc and cadmium transporter
VIWWIVVFALLGGVGAALGSALVLAIPERMRSRASPWLISYSVGTLLGAAFLAMIPEAMSQIPATEISIALLAGVLAFFTLEKVLLWRHGHGVQPNYPRSTGVFILIGDGFHNFIDGVVIAAAFLTSVPLGVAVSLAVIAHEIPQEVGDFTILLEAGHRPKTAFVLNTLAATATLPGALSGYFWLPLISQTIPYFLAASAASFIYIAMADHIPGMHSRGALSSALQLALIVAGIATIAILHIGG